jgi:Cd2+/Zn2+-exporting ATPase
MDCPTEERLIRNRLDGMEGVDHLDFNLMSRTLTVSYSGVEETAIAAAISTLGMEAVPQAVGPHAVQLPLVQRSFWRKPGTILTVVAGVCAIAAELLAVTAYSDDAIVVRLLAAIAIVTGGYETAGKAFVALRTFTLNIHFLMTLAVIGAVALGAWTEGGMVIFLFAVAELVEAQSLNRARGAIRMLMALAPDTALVLRGPTPQTMPVGEIAVGELVRIKPGERLPLDGIVRTGHSAVNQAPITGESMPVDKEPGDRVFAGSINGTGTIDYEVTHLASDSTIGRIAHLVEKATANRGRTERFVDQFARYYTPAIFGLAVVVAVLPPLLGGGWNNWVYNALVLLVIGCPCALVISTPVTIVSALSASARRGILVKGGEFMELGRKLRGIAFDKTGTLTQAKPHVTDVISLDGLAAGELLHLAAAVEGKSEHPIASANIGKS